jgi:hypothetical protein
MYRNTRHWDGDSLLEETFRDVTWNEVRRARDKALSDSDWRALKDVTLPNPWKEYRQALRDLPQLHDTANDAVDHWPEVPE